MNLFKVYASNITPGKTKVSANYFFNLNQLTSFYGCLTGSTYLYLTFSSGETYEVTDYKGITRFCKLMNITLDDLYN